MRRGHNRWCGNGGGGKIVVGSLGFHKSWTGLTQMWR